jgi:hypothetical protein
MTELEQILHELRKQTTIQAAILETDREILETDKEILAALQPSLPASFDIVFATPTPKLMRN